MENIKADFFKQNIHNGQNYLADKSTVIDFYADWCGPCKMVAPALQQLSKEYEGKVSFYKINVDDEPEYVESLYARPLANKTVTLSFWMKMSVAGAMIVQAYNASAEDNFTTTTELLNNSSTNATTSWARYSFTFTTTNNASNGMIVQKTCTNMGNK